MESVIVYTGRDLRRMREEGGCGHWTASPIRVEAAEYLVCVRNRREQWAAMDYEHGDAFLVARIARTKPSAQAARITIEFNSYALIKVPDAWQLLAHRQRFPVAYLETEELFRRLQIKPDELEWQPLAEDARKAHAPEGQTSCSPALNAAQGNDLTWTITEAKRSLAKCLGIAAETIEITIRC